MEQLLLRYSKCNGVQSYCLNQEPNKNNNNNNNNNKNKNYYHRKVTRGSYFWIFTLTVFAWSSAPTTYAFVSPLGIKPGSIGIQHESLYDRSMRRRKLYSKSKDDTTNSYSLLVPRRRFNKDPNNLGREIKQTKASQHNTISSKQSNNYSNKKPSKNIRVTSSSNIQGHSTPIASSTMDPSHTFLTTTEKIGNISLGIIVVGSLLYGLAGGGGGGNLIEEEISVTETVISTIAPQSATDIIAVTIGEGLGGLVGAGATSFLVGNKNKDSNIAATTDYFITRAAALPLFLSLGFDSLTASIFGSLVASVPYEAVKWQQRNKQQKDIENQLLEQMRLEEQKKLKKKQDNPWTLGKAILQIRQKPLLSPFSSSGDKQFSENQAMSTMKSVNVTQLEELSPNNKFDVPEIISDVVIWLEYAVLQSNFGDVALFSQYAAMLQPAIFGALAALSSQLYLDALYQFTEWGPEDKSKEARTRTFQEGLAVYGSACLNAATLFGVYELVRKPTGMVITNLLSGGVQGCFGSTDYDTCIETYEYEYVFSSFSSTPASLTSEVRALAVAVFSLVQNFTPNFEAEFRALAVALFSLVQRLLGNL